MSSLGLKDALKGIGDAGWDSPPATPTPTAGSGDNQIDMRLIDLDPDQPRKKFDADTLDELADSIRQHKLQQAIGLRPHPTAAGRYVITFGERRFRAFQLLGRESIPATIRDTENAPFVALVENLQREDLTAWEIASALAQVAATTKKKYTDIAKAIGKSNVWVTNYMSLRRMPTLFTECLEAGIVNDITTLVEAHKLYGNFPDEVTKLLSSASPDKPVSRDAVRKLAAKLNGEDARPKGGKAKKSTPAVGDETADGAGADAAATSDNAALPSIFVADEDGDEIGCLDVGRATDAGYAYVIRDDAGLSTREPFAKLRITRIVIG